MAKSTGTEAPQKVDYNDAVAESKIYFGAMISPQPFGSRNTP